LSRRAVESIEAVADGLTPKETGTASQLICFDKASFSLDVNFVYPFRECSHILSTLAFATTWFLDDRSRRQTVADARIVQAQLLRDVIGNPFRPVALDPRWLTSTVVALAAGIYADRAFDRLPILADALEDAGCDSADILAHCRSDGPHARGCWVVDLVLGKS
jgi:hypothetical protein